MKSEEEEILANINDQELIDSIAERKTFQEFYDFAKLVKEKEEELMQLQFSLEPQDIAEHDAPYDLGYGFESLEIEDE